MIKSEISIKNKKKFLMEGLKGNQSIAFVGGPGSGKTMGLIECVDSLVSIESVRIVSISHDSELTQDNENVTKNKIPAETWSDENFHSEIKMLDVPWQDLEFPDPYRHFGSERLFSMSADKIIEFVESSDKPCLVIVEDMEFAKKNQLKDFSRIFEAIKKNDGYFYFTSGLVGTEEFLLLLDKVEGFICLDDVHRTNSFARPSDVIWSFVGERRVYGVMDGKQVD